jgi:hypothetical protein
LAKTRGLYIAGDGGKVTTRNSESRRKERKRTELSAFPRTKLGTRTWRRRERANADDVQEEGDENILGFIKTEKGC